MKGCTVKDLLFIVAVACIVALLITGVMLFFIEVLDVSNHQEREACWSEYGESRVDDISARCRVLMGFTE